jgi:hypothetical protein
MLDWFVLLAPLLLLPIVALFGFAGCTLLFPFAEPEDEGEVGALTFEVRVHRSHLGDEPEDQVQVRVGLRPPEALEWGAALEPSGSSASEAEMFIYPFERRELPAGTYDIRCRIFDSNGERLIATEESVPGAAACSVTVETEQQVVFEAARGAEFIVVQSGCDE